MNKKSINNAPRPPLNLRGGGRKAGGDIDAVDVQSLQEEIAILDQNWKRALADYQNLLKRVENEKGEIIKLASLNVVSKLVPSLDILELAAKHNQDEGIQMAVKQFQQVLRDEGLEEINPTVGDKFDPILHECIETMVGEPIETIATVAAKGYKINGFTLRPAKVRVFQKEEPHPEPVEGAKVWQK